MSLTWALNYEYSNSHLQDGEVKSICKLQKLLLCITWGGGGINYDDSKQTGLLF